MPLTDAKLVLPVAPSTESGPVKAWSQPVEMMTYPPGRPDPNPLFLEKRVYQGSSGKVYPLPVIDSVETEPRQAEWQAIHIENEYLRLMILPQIGGRIHIGLDKRTGYDFFYRQDVIKPALVGLAGPWISGGVEFNWPQHHRPATFMAVEIAIERSEDGSVTVWCSDHDPIARMKGMHGICLHPGKAYVEVKVRLYNRTLDTQTFLWWANVATRVHAQYQSFFPHDVRFAADHAKRAITTYPLSQGTYYGVDYAERARTGVPAHAAPPDFVPDGSYPANDLGWYANIPVPTSYMIVGSQDDFFGGYDHRAQAGTVAFANHHISPGKKQWTWGNHEFGYAWDRSLTDGGGPYIELMSGVYTDNQPDFSFLAPGETKTFSQFWYPIGSVGVPDAANLSGALRLQHDAGKVTLHVQLTETRPGTTVVLKNGGQELARWQADLHAGEVGTYTAQVAADSKLEAQILHDGHVLLRYAPAEIAAAPEPEVATEPPLPQDVQGNDELYLTGVHLEQYRHPTRDPEEYWLEAVRRDGGDSRCNHALGRFYMRRGEFEVAEAYLRTSLARLMRRNPNPSDGEPHYNLGRVLLLQGRVSEAYAAFYKSTWVAAWRGPGYQRVAEIDMRRGEWQKALDHLEHSLIAEAENLGALNLKVIALRALGLQLEADRLLQSIRKLDPLDVTSSFLQTGTAPQDAQQQIDLALDLLRAGLTAVADAVLRQPTAADYSGGNTMRLYLRSHVLTEQGRPEEARALASQAAEADPAYVFPHRLEEMLVLERAIAANPQDAHAHLFLGNLLFDRRRHREAAALWQRSVALDPSNSVAWRNLGIARFNVLQVAAGAAEAFAHARSAAPNDARILYEQDQLQKRIGVSLDTRISELQKDLSLVNRRDDLTAQYVSLLTSCGNPAEALRVLGGRRFGPWEGGEGEVLGQYVRANIQLAVNRLKADDPLGALALLHDALHPPASLGEARHLLANLSTVDYWIGVAANASGAKDDATEAWESAARHKGDFQQMQVQTISEMTYWSAMSLDRLGRREEAVALFQAIDAFAGELEQETPKIDYFATSLPTLLLFQEDLQKRQTITARFLSAQAQLGLRSREAGECMLREVLALDHSHTGAIDMLHMLALGVL